MTIASLPLTASADGVRVNIRVTPRASRNRVEGVREGRLVVKVTAPPVDRAANDAVVALVAETLDVPKRSVRLTVGGQSRNKSLVISGITEAEVRAKLAESLDF